MTETTATPGRAPGEGGGVREWADSVAALLEAERRAQDDDSNNETDDPVGAAATFLGDTGAAGDETTGFDDPEPGEQPSDTGISPSADDKAAPETFQVRVNGEDLTVTRDELLRGYSRTSDYKQKTARLAEERRSVDTERQSLAAERQQIEQSRAQAYVLALEHATEDALTVAKGAKTDWSALSKQDPAKAQSDWFEYQAARERVGQALLQARRQAAADQQQALRRAVARHQDQLAGEARAAVEAIPELQDGAQGAALLTGLRDYLGSVGFEAAELERLSDHRLMVVARDAMLYRQMLAKQRSAAAKKRAEAPRVMSPTRSDPASSDSDRLRSLRKRAQETGKLRDNAEYVLAKLRSH
ncbi:MAG TPA: hypothetical protein VHA07_14780 [Devosia sp.]|nr:hypothetical protein [Devosia sp.]